MDKVSNKNISIVVRKDIENWEILNTIAHISCYFGNRMREEFGAEDFFETKDGVKHPRNSKRPIEVLMAEEKDMVGFMKDVRKSGMEYIGFIREMIEETEEAKIEKKLKQKHDSEVEYLGIGVFGDKEKLAKLTAKFDLYK